MYSVLDSMSTTFFVYNMTLHSICRSGKNSESDDVSSSGESSGITSCSTPPKSSNHEDAAALHDRIQSYSVSLTTFLINPSMYMTEPRETNTVLLDRFWQPMECADQVPYDLGFTFFALSHKSICICMSKEAFSVSLMSSSVVIQHSCFT